MSDKRSALGIGEKLSLIGKDSNGCEYQTVYVIKDLAGCGGSSIVYKAVTTERIEKQNETTLFTRTHMIKEFYPSTLAEGTACLTRNAAGTLVVPEALQDRFNDRKDHFLSGYSKHVTFYEAAPNQTLQAPAVRQANNTVYTIMEFRDGETLEKNRSELSSLHDIVEVIISLVGAIKCYHQSSPVLVHLDIKPQNIYKYRDENRIALFDFDTVQKLDDIRLGTAENLSYSEIWAAPEQQFRETYPRVCEATDIFSIGAVMFWLIMEREPTSRDADTILGGKWDLQKESRFCQTIDHRGLTLIRKIFTHTLKNLIENRYQQVDELLADLENLRERCRPGAQYLLYTAPPPVSTFTDRIEKFHEIEQRLAKQGWLLIYGIGGIGKSELIKEYIKRNKRKYETVCFLSYKDSLLSTIGMTLPIEECDYAENESVAFNYQIKMEILKSYGEETLLVIDNFDRTRDQDGNSQKATCDPKFSELRSGGYHVIFTSRVKHDERLDLEEIEGGYQQELFFKHYKKELSEEERAAVDKIFAIIGGHTLTLILVAKTLFRGRRISPETLLEKLSANVNAQVPERIDHERDGEIHSDVMYAHIDSIFDVSKLSENEQSILMNLALVPRTGIEAVLFGDWLELTDFNDLNDLEDTGWIVRDVATDIVSLHPVIADVVANKLQPDSAKCEKYLTALLNYCQVTEYDEKGVAFHVRALTLGIGAVDRIRDETVVMGDLHAELGNLLRLLARYDEAHVQFIEALDIFKQCLHENSLQAAGVYVNRGLAFEAQASHQKALSDYYQALEIRENNDAADPIKIADLYNHIGYVHYITKKYDEALGFHFKALNIQQYLNSLQAANSLHNIGICKNAQSNLEEALDYKMKALKIWEEHLPENHRKIGTLCDSIGIVLKDLTIYDQSLAYYQRSLDLKLNSLPENHPSIAITYSHIATVYGIIGKYDDAITYHEKALELCKKTLPSDHFRLANSYDSVGKYLRIQGNYDQAIQYHLKALEIYENRNEMTSPRIAIFNNYLGAAYREKGDLIQAFNCHFKALEIHKINTLTNHPVISITFNQISEDYLAKKDYATAIKYLLKAFKVCKTRLPASHPRIGVTCSNLGRAYVGLNQPEVALDYYLKALGIYEEKLPFTHPDISTLCKNIGDLYTSQGDSETAREYFIKAEPAG